MVQKRSIQTRIILGATLAAAIALLLKAISHWLVFIPNPGVFFILSIAVAGYFWGMPAALAAAPVAILASLYSYAEPGQWMRYTPSNIVRIIVMAISAPATAFLVGHLKNRSDRSLSASEDRYRALIEATPDAVFVQQTELIVYANPAAHDAFRVAPDHDGGAPLNPQARLIGSSIWDRLHPDSHDLVRARLQLMSRGSDIAPPVEETWIRLDQSTFLAEVAARRITFNRRPAVLVVLHDLTRRREMEQRIRDQVRDLSLLQEVSRAFLFGLTPAEIPEYLCSIIRERTGVYHAWVALVCPDGTLAPAWGGGCDAAHMLSAHNIGDPAPDGPLDLVRRAIRQTKPIVVPDVLADPSLAPWHDPARQLGYRAAAAFPLISGDQVVAVLSVSHADPGGLTEARMLLIQSLVNLAAIALGEAQAHALITRRAQNLEIAVSHRTAELHDAAREMQAFTYSVSHDLRAPLRAIGGFSEIILRRYSAAIPPEAHRYLENIVSAGAHMLKLIDDLLRYARLGRRGAELQRVDLNRLVQHILNDLSGRVNETAAQVQVPDELPMLFTDPTLLRQILTNLIDNALTYHAPEKPPIVQLICQTYPDSIRLQVIDRGIGIAPEYRDSIFNIFQRLHSADEFPGTGIGLAIVKKSAALLNGSVSVESSPGNGSTFTVTLPVSANARPVKQAN